MKPAFQWILDRAQEKTTWIGLIGALTTFGWYIDPALATQIAQTGAAIASLILVITKEKSS